MSTDDDMYGEAREFVERFAEGLDEQEREERFREFFERAVEARKRLVAEGEARHEEWLRETGIGAWFDTP